MIIGERIRDIREDKRLSQGDIEARTGLLRCYISRVENGHTVPAIETLEKLARALETPLYQIFYDGNVAVPPPAKKIRKSKHWGSAGKSARYMARLTPLLSRMESRDRDLILAIVRKLVQTKSKSVAE